MLSLSRLILLRMIAAMVIALTVAAVYGDTSVVDPADRRQVVLIKPVIVCDDDGGNPATFVLAKDLLDKMNETTAIEFLFLEPIRWSNGPLRRGEDDLQPMIREGLRRRILCRDRHVLNLLFVSEMKTDERPAARVDEDGNTILIALKTTGMGSSNDDPVLQSDREFVAQQVEKALRDSAAAEPERSFVFDRIQFHSGASGRALLIDQSWEPYLDEATDDFLRFSIGLTKGDPIPQDANARHAMVTERYSEKVLEFSEAEQALIRERLQRLAKLTGQDWPSVARMPWHFVKVDSSFCSGFPHTRGLTIVIPEQALQMIQFSETGGLSLLLHEKLHVLQRINATRFDALYEAYGFERISMAAGELERMGVAQNPDAFQIEWALRFGGDLSAMAMMFATDANQKLKFELQYRRLNVRPDGTCVFGDVIEMDSEFRQWQRGFGMSMGLEHPNETSAYLSGPLLQADYLSKSRPRLAENAKGNPDQRNSVSRLDQTRNAFESIMRVD